jgi:hypothetical protein
MTRMASVCGQPCYAPASDTVRVFVTVQGGHLTAEFNGRGGILEPFYTAPWWKEPWMEDADWIIRLLRGDFFCLPFGSNVEPVGGRKYLLHGRTANDCWEPVSSEERKGETTLVARMDLDEPGSEVEKTIRLLDGQPVIYQRHVVRGLELKSPVAHHPTLQCPEAPGSAIVDLSPPLAGFTIPSPVDIPENKGYGLLMPNAAITDRTRVPTVYGGVADTSRYPVRRGHEDGVMYVNDPAREFVFTSVTMPERGLLYFQLKNPRVFSETLFWMCDGGRYSAPFNGRATGVLGAEEITGYFWEGIKPSIEPNAIAQKVYRTTVDFRRGTPQDFRLIMAAIPVSKDFAGVTDIIRANAKSVTVLGRRGERIDVPCEVDYLKGTPREA